MRTLARFAAEMKIPEFHEHTQTVDFISFGDLFFDNSMGNDI
jgi:hypothetical protein